MEHSIFKYHYHLFWFPTDYYKIAYSDLDNSKDITFHWGIGSSLNKCLATIYRLHNVPAINRYVNLPWKKKWFPYLFPIDSSKQNCFLFTPKFFYNEEQRSFVQYLKHNYPNSKTVLYYQDIASTHAPFQQGRDFWNLFDVVLSYDQTEANNYGFRFYPTSYSLNIKNKLSTEKPKSDVLFIGRAKDRFPLILKIYDYLENNGLNCLFKLIDVDPVERVERKGISFLDNNISYRENLEYVMQTKVLLDILQNGASGCSLRFWESIAFEKIILSNNDSNPIGRMSNKILFNEKNIENINIGRLLNAPIIDPNLKEKLSPFGLIRYIDSII